MGAAFDVVTLPVTGQALEFTAENLEEMKEFVGAGKLVDGKPEFCYVKVDDTTGRWVPTSVPGEYQRHAFLINSSRYGLEFVMETEWVIKVQRAPPYENGLVFMKAVDFHKSFVKPPPSNPDSES
jgi:hypothetical protein